MRAKTVYKDRGEARGTEDREIIEQLWQRSEAGLDAAGASHGPFCRAIAENILGSREDAEECFSDALLRLWNAVPPERPQHLRAYLAKLTRRLAIDRLRTRTAEKRGGGELPLVLSELAECIPGGQGTEDAAMTRALGEAVNRFLRTLPARERAIFVRRCFRVESNRDIARALGMGANAVAVSLRRTRQKLRAQLEKEGFLP